MASGRRSVPMSGGDPPRRDATPPVPGAGTAKADAGSSSRSPSGTMHFGSFSADIYRRDQDPMSASDAGSFSRSPPAPTPSGSFSTGSYRRSQDPMTGRGNASPPASGQDGTPPAVLVPPVGIFSYQVLGAKSLPRLFKQNTSVIQAVSKPCAPSTPSPTAHGRVQSSKSCRSRLWRSRSPSPGRHATKCQIASRKEEIRNFDQQKSAFKAYLDTCCVGLANQMWQEQSFCLSIDYDELKRENKSLAYDIANHFQEIKGKLHAAAQEFLREQYRVKDIVQGMTPEMLENKIRKVTKLRFSWMPKSIMSLEDFLHIHRTTTRYLFARHHRCRYRVAVMSPAARKILREIVTYVTSYHKKGLAWSGKWNISDWEVVDGSLVHLRVSPVQLVGISMRHEDLEAIASKIVTKMTHNGKAGGMYPAYLRDLCQQLKTVETAALADADFSDWFYEFLQYHPALLSSKARATLIKGLYGAAVDLDYSNYPCYDVIFKNRFVGEWMNFVYRGRRNVHVILWKVFWDKNPPADGTSQEIWDLPYQGVAEDLLKMLRHLLVHASRYTKTSNGQAMEGNAEPELFAADIFQRYLPGLIKLIFQRQMMHGEIAKEWEYYKNSKDFMGE